MLEWIQEIMTAMGYVGIAALMFLENVFPPIPSELVMPLAGFATTDGSLSFVGVVIAGMVGSVAAAVPMYYVGAIVGERRLRVWADRYGKWLGVSGEDVTCAKMWFDRHGSKAVLLCRLVPGVRSWISIPAGMSHMSLSKFVLYTALGTAAWSALLAYVGRLLGENYAEVERYVGPVGSIVLMSAFVLGVVWVLKRKVVKAAQPEQQAP